MVRAMASGVIHAGRASVGPMAGVRMDGSRRNGESYADFARPTQIAWVNIGPPLPFTKLRPARSVTVVPEDDLLGRLVAVRGQRDQRPDGQPLYVIEPDEQRLLDLAL